MKMSLKKDVADHLAALTNAYIRYPVTFWNLICANVHLKEESDIQRAVCNTISIFKEMRVDYVAAVCSAISNFKEMRVDYVICWSVGN
ncbi:hypothetical protein C5167_006584 [Papaver somniferum]|uniref:Uncharacterized protein n=1 Tax=Papaver somniferum TaxID=3469 RepID=A0A4Y7JH70_PAPSO|nr:hypothetical protein C5167_006584 [Papaver somniferum]